MLKCYTYEIFIAILQFQRAEDWGGKQTRLDRMPVCGAATGMSHPLRRNGEKGAAGKGEQAQAATAERWDPGRTLDKI